MVKCFLILMVIALGAHGQPLSFDLPERLPINSPCEEIFPILSADGRELFFVRTNWFGNTGGKNAGSDIWISSWSEMSGWSKPVNGRYNLNDKHNNAIIGAGKEGRTLYQLNTSASKSVSGIYALSRLGNSWTHPELIPVSFLKTENFLGVYIDRDEKVMLLSMERIDSRGEEDLYVSFKDSKGEWSIPRNLGLDINTRGFEISPFLSADNNRLFFSSNGHGGVGDADIFYCDRIDDTWENWTDPVNLVEVNSAFFDAYFSIYDSIAFFSSNRDSEYSDLYQIRIRKQVIVKQDPQAQKVIAEARQLLNDLSDDTADSLTTAEKISVIEFETNSARIENNTLSQLKSLVTNLKKASIHKITLVGYSSESDKQHVRLSLQRLESLRNYFNAWPIPNAIVETEVRKQDRRWASKKDFVEVRYK